MRSTITAIIFATVAAAGAVSMTASAAVAAEAPAVSLQVSYAGLDLNDAQGAKTMLRRIRHAAADVCNAVPSNLGGSIDAVEGFNHCYDQAVTKAVSTLNAPQVIQAFNGRAPTATLAAR